MEQIRKKNKASLRWPYCFRKKEGYKLAIPHLAGALYKRDCFFENLFIKHVKLPKIGIRNICGDEEIIIVSLTSFPERMESCYYAIKSLMIQSLLAHRIILWLAESQFPEHVLPKQFDELIDRGLEIKFCDDLKSHKKYYYALQEQRPNEVVITFDDDIIYEYDAIEKLVKKHKQFPNCVVCNRGHEMIFQNGQLAPYKTWKSNTDAAIKEPYLWILMSTGAGCLYPYNCMPERTFNKDLIKQYAPTADDLWMTYNRIFNNVKVIKTRKKIAILCNVNNSQSISLTSVNDVGGENDKVIEKLNVLFKDIFQNKT